MKTRAFLLAAVCAVLVVFATPSAAQDAVAPTTIGIAPPVPVIGGDGTMQVVNACENPGEATLVSVLSNAPEAHAMRLGNTPDEVARAEWRPYQQVVQWYAPAQDTALDLRAVFAEYLMLHPKHVAHATSPVPLAISHTLCLRPFAHHDTPPQDPAFLARFRFRTWQREWVSYDFQGVPKGNLFFPLSWTSTGGWDGGSYVWTDSSRWSIDTPETPHSILFALIYARWMYANPRFKSDTLDLTGANVSFALRGADLDLKGARVTFWITNGDGRFHFDAPIEVRDREWRTTRFDLSAGRWQQSWARNPVRGAPDLTSVNSFGLAFVGFPPDEEVTGAIAIDDFEIRRPGR